MTTVTTTILPARAPELIPSRVHSTYHKTHLFGAEATYFDIPPWAPELSHFDTSFGVRFGQFICFDVTCSRQPVVERPATSNCCHPQSHCTDGLCDPRGGGGPQAWHHQLCVLHAVVQRLLHAPHASCTDAASLLPRQQCHSPCVRCARICPPHTTPRGNCQQG